MNDPIAIHGQVLRAARIFANAFQRPPRFAVVAPGRVNLIGEHTDYNDGFVLPLAINRQTVIVADHGTAAGQGTFFSTNSDDPGRFPISADLQPGPPAWSNYVRGVIALCLQRGLNPGAIDAVIDSTVPVGGGLSSSAALEVATATLVEAMTGSRIDAVAKALLCQKAEHDFPKMPCGIMDQFISVMGREGQAMLLDCRSRQVRWVKLRDPAVTVLIINSNVKHELTGGEYAQRRAQCEQAARILGVGALRDVNERTLTQGREKLDELTFRRARHVVTENARTVKAADAADAGQWGQLGQLMLQSHESLRDDFEVSCAELNLLVELTSRYIDSGAIYGTRMTGGGFGGCTVSLARADTVAQVSQQIAAAYQQQTGIAPTVFVTRPAAGARILEL